MGKSLVSCFFETRCKFLTNLRPAVRLVVPITNQLSAGRVLGFAHHHSCVSAALAGAITNTLASSAANLSAAAAAVDRWDRRADGQTDGRSNVS